MKCKICGNKHSFFSMKCPMCSGRTWTYTLLLGKPSNKESENKRNSIYFWNRILSRMIVWMLVLIVGAVLFLIGYEAVSTGISSIRYKYKKEEIINTLEGYYESGEFMQMYDYLDKTGYLWRDDLDEYSNAAFLGYYYDNYVTYKLEFLCMEEEYKESKQFYLNEAIRYVFLVYKQENKFSDQTQRNKELFTRYKQEIQSFFKGTCKFSEEEIEKIEADLRVDGSMSELNEKYTSIAMERKGWIDED